MVETEPICFLQCHDKQALFICLAKVQWSSCYLGFGSKVAQLTSRMWHHPWLHPLLVWSSLRSSLSSTVDIQGGSGHVQAYFANVLALCPFHVDDSQKFSSLSHTHSTISHSVFLTNARQVFHRQPSHIYTSTLSVIAKVMPLDISLFFFTMPALTPLTPAHLNTGQRWQEASGGQSVGASKVRNVSMCLAHRHCTMADPVKHCTYPVYVTQKRRDSLPSVMSNRLPFWGFKQVCMGQQSSCAIHL